MKNQEIIRDLFKYIYPHKNTTELLDTTNNIIKSYKNKCPENRTWNIDEKSIMLITYGDSIYEEGTKTLQTLNDFLDKNVKDNISAVHLLPCFPYSSDDGFSIIDYYKIDDKLGSWHDINNLSSKYHIMLDAVVNHVSAKSQWFKDYLKGVGKYTDYFIECDKSLDYSQVVRPRSLPLLTRFKNNKYLWTTFSVDQIDLNYASPNLFFQVLDVLLFYASNGAEYIRLDAIAFIWKEHGTSCIHHEKTHKIIQLYRAIIEQIFPSLKIITETNVPHKENMSYFGNGSNEAHLVYNFALPPLVLYSFHSNSSNKITQWAKSLDNDTTIDTCFFNFLSSHDGIGVRPVEDILNNKELQLLLDNTLKNKGNISYKDNSDGSKAPYELNINYLDALRKDNDNNEQLAKRFLSASVILLSFAGVPGIYIHSLLGSQNDYKGLEKLKYNRAINREKLERLKLEQHLNKKNSIRNIVFTNYLKLLHIRRNTPQFSPFAKQRILELNEKVFSILRGEENNGVLCLINISDNKVELELPKYYSNIKIVDLITSDTIKCKELTLKPNQSVWLKN